MGLDGVELVMELEDRFAVELPDAEVSRVRTVADAAALIIARLPRTQDVCPTTRMFYTIRRLFAQHAAIPRESVRPAQRLDDLFASGRPSLWRELRRHERRLPPLRAPEHVDRIMLLVTAICALAAVGVIATMWIVLGGVTAAFLGLGMIVAYATGSRLLMHRFSTHWPQGVETVGDLARAIAPFDASYGSPGQRLLTHIQVLDEVRRITAEQLGISLEKVTPESDFVKDLEID